jgi:FMN-dependent dehydrogenase
MTSSNDQPSVQPNLGNILDELCIVPASLESRLSESNKVDLTCCFSAAERHRKTRIASPFVLRSFINRAWELDQIDELSGAMREIGGAVVAESKSLNHVSINHVPFRICPIFVDSFPDSSELESADVIELQLFARDSVSSYLNSGQAQWPWDVIDAECLAKKIEVLRQLAGSSIPVGVAMPAGAVRADVKLLLRCGADFVTLVNHPNRNASATLPDAWIAAAARTAAIQNGSPSFPVFLAGSIRNGSDVAKLIALGASGCVVDALVASKPSAKTLAPDPMSYSMLSEIASSFAVSQATTSSESHAGILSRLVNELTSSLESCGYENLASFSNKPLVATTMRAQQLTGIPMLNN